MSTVRANAITDASGGNTATINSMTPTADSLQGFRNRIINGDMRIDQRNAGAAVTVNSVNDTYSVDRFLGAGQSTDGVFTLQRSTTAPTGFTNSLVATVTTADASVGAAQYYLVTQKIEGFNVSDLGFGTANAKTVTLSFWVRSSVTGTFSGALANGAYNRSYPFTYTISSANTFEYKTVTIAGDTTGTWLTDNGIGLRVYWNLGTGVDNTGTAGAWTGAGNVGADSTVALISTLNATWYITGVQLEVGSVATPFERRPYGTELMLCQRYYEQWQGTSTNYSPAGTGLAYANNSVVLPWIYKVTKRIASPSLIVSSAAALAPSNGVGSVTASNSIGLSGVTQVNDQSMMITVSVATTPFTVGQASLVYLTNSSSAYIAVSAEL